MGDPETEVVMPRIESDLVTHLLAVGDQNINPQDLKITTDACATVMLVSGGYPGPYEKGKTVHGIDEVRDCLIFHAGTKREGYQLLTNGGRVLAITTLAKLPQEAIEKCYNEIEHITFDGQYYRTDIGFDL